MRNLTLTLFKLIRLVSRLFRTLVIQKAGENQMKTDTLITFLIFNFRIANGRFLHRIFLANFGPETEHGRYWTIYFRIIVQLEFFDENGIHYLKNISDSDN